MPGDGAGGGGAGAGAGPATGADLDARAARKARRFEFVYRAGLLLKGIDGTFEVVAGLALWLFPDALARLIAPLAQAEVGPHPYRNFLAYWVGRADHELVAGHHLFAIAFLLLHGVVKLVLVYCLLREFHWVYPWALAVLGAFVVYQAYVLIRTPTIGMALLTALDVVVVWLVWREWRQVRIRSAGAGPRGGSGEPGGGVGAGGGSASGPEAGAGASTAPAP